MKSFLAVVFALSFALVSGHARAGKHFYTTNAAEFDAALRNHFVSEGQEGHVFDPKVAPPRGAVPFVRLYREITHQHLYTSDLAEMAAAIRSGGFVLEGRVGFVFPSDAKDLGGEFTPLHRFYDPVQADHIYSADPEALTHLKARGWVGQHEGIAAWVHLTATPGTLPLYRAYTESCSGVCAPDKFTAEQKRNTVVGGGIAAAAIGCVIAGICTASKDGVGFHKEWD